MFYEGGNKILTVSGARPVTSASDGEPSAQPRGRTRHPSRDSQEGAKS
jgi:hypothetical protein